KNPIVWVRLGGVKGPELGTPCRESLLNKSEVPRHSSDSLGSIHQSPGRRSTHRQQSRRRKILPFPCHHHRQRNRHRSRPRRRTATAYGAFACSVGIVRRVRGHHLAGHSTHDTNAEAHVADGVPPASVDSVSVRTS